MKDELMEELSAFYRTLLYQLIATRMLPAVLFPHFVEQTETFVGNRTSYIMSKLRPRDRHAT